MPTGGNLRNQLAESVQEFVPFLADYFPITGEYGSSTAAGPNKGAPHKAVDFGTPKGTPLYSMGSGVVLNPADNPEGVTGGKTITVDYGNGIIVSFSHLDEIFVKAGDVIAPGDWIGNTGNTGISTGPHLHVDAWKDGVKTDVRELIDWAADFSDYEEHSGATGGSIPILGPLTGGARGGLDAMGQIAASVVAFVTTILNPETWARIVAIFGGAILSLIGFYMVWQST